MKIEVEYRYKNDKLNHHIMTMFVTADTEKRALERCEEIIDNRYFEVIKVVR